MVSKTLNRSFIFVSTVCTFSPTSVTLAFKFFTLSSIFAVVSLLLGFISAFISALLCSSASVKLDFCASILAVNSAIFSSALAALCSNFASILAVISAFALSAFSNFALISAAFCSALAAFY